MNDRLDQVMSQIVHGPTRIPAQDMEGTVCRGIHPLLNSPEQLLEAVRLEIRWRTTIKSLIRAGKQLVKLWPAQSLAHHREFLNTVISRIVVHETCLE
jgi:hypothetical protein